MDKEKLEKELNEINFYKCKGIKAGYALHYEILEKVGFKQVIKSFAKAAYFSIFSFCRFEQKGTAKTLMLFSYSYRTRADHRRAFDNVAELVDDRLTVTPLRRKFNPANIKYLFLPFVWAHQMRNTSAGLGERIVLSCGSLLRSFHDFTDVDRYMNKNGLDIKYLITYCDVMPVDSFFVQKFKARGIITVTLQHGSFNVMTNPWAYSASKSDYFLAESPAAVDLAHSVGYNGNIIPVGSPHQLKLDDPKMPASFKKVEKIGVVMNSDAPGREDNLRADNAAMLNAVSEYCNAESKKMIVKFHPSNLPADYMQYIDDSVAETHTTDITIDEFGDMCDVVIVSASTVFTTMLKRWKPVLMFARKDSNIEHFSGTEDIKFENEKQLAEKISFIDTTEYKNLTEEYRNYFLCSGKYEENYRNAFEKIGIL